MSKNQKDSYTVSVGDRLAAARKEVHPKLTQAKAAELLSALMGEEITGQAIANYEQGTRLPHPKIVDGLCEIYGNVSAAFVLGFHDAPQSMRETTLLKKYRMADDRGKYALDRLADVESTTVEDGRDKESTDAA